MNPASLLWVFLALAAAAGWGLQYSVMEHMLKGTRAVDLLTYYFCGGALLCLIYNLVTRGSIPLPAKNEVFPVIIIVVVGLFAMLAITGAIWGKNSTQASLLENAVPLFAFLFSGLLFGHWELNLRTFFGAGFIFAGIALVGSR